MIMLSAAMVMMGVHSTKVGSEATVNPIRRVVTMLQSIQKKVEAEAARDEELHKKFMCYCKTGSATLEKSIADAEAKIGDVKSQIEESKAQKAQLEQDLVSHKKDRAAAKEAASSATSLREKDAATYSAFKAEADA